MNVIRSWGLWRPSATQAWFCTASSTSPECGLAKQGEGGVSGLREHCSWRAPSLIQEDFVSLSSLSLWEWLCLRLFQRMFLWHSVWCFGCSPRRPTRKMDRDSFILYHVTRKQQWQLTNHYIFHNTDKLQLVTSMQRVLLHFPYYTLFQSIIVFWMMLALS